MFFARYFKSAIVIPAALLTGCAVGPDFHAPSLPSGAGYTHEPLATSSAKAPGPQGDMQKFVSDTDIPGQWWTLFHSPQLNAAIKMALIANPSIAAAKASLRAAHEDMLAENGPLYPSLTAGATAGDIRTASGVLAPTSASGVPEYSLYTGQLNVAYSLDIFGLNRRKRESTEAAFDMKHFEFEAARVSITTNIVMAAAGEAGASAELAAQQDIIKADTEVTDLIRRQYELGSAAKADLLQQEAVLAEARSMLPEMEKRVAQQHNALTALAGGFPNQDLVAPFALDVLKLPRDLPVSLPSRLVEQRPDILAAEAGVHMASAELGVAVAARLPQLNLSADIGTATQVLSGPLGMGNLFFNTVGGLTAPLFTGGRLEHQENAAQARLDAAEAAYRNVVITAFRDVSDTLRAIQSDAETLKEKEAAEDAADKSLALAREQLKLGDGSILYVLDAEHRYALARQATVKARVARIADSAALFQALGGGWWHLEAPEQANAVAAVVQ